KEVNKQPGKERTHSNVFTDEIQKVAPGCFRVLRVVATNASSANPKSIGHTGTRLSESGRVLRRLHDCGRVQCPCSPRGRYRKHSIGLVFTLFSRWRQLQHRHRCWSAGVDHCEWKYRNWRGIDVA